MLTRSRPSWFLPESAATPESVYLDRRKLMKGMAGAAMLPAIGGFAVPALAADARAMLTGALNKAYTEGGPHRPPTPEEMNLHYNNFFEFGSQKAIYDEAERTLKPRPWTISIEGMVEKPLTLDVDELMKKMTLEERVYRHRCVEAWSMVVPWVGFPLRKLVELAQPMASARYLEMQTFNDPGMAAGIRTQPWYPWPYIEGLTMAEATNDLPFMAVGAYGKVLANPMGAPIRLHLPWKYGFKSIKSIVRFTFTDKRPVGFWEEISNQSGNTEYGFWANVNPKVPHPRWSQANERVLSTGETIPTELFNGYGEQVASLYAGMGDVGDMLYR